MAAPITREQDRLDLQHHLCNLSFDNKLFFAPIGKNPQHCLDIGTGTGIWALDFADQHPSCQVLGIDLSPGQPNFVPPNLKFIIDDAEDLWIYDQKFDFIHSRMMAGSIADFPKLITSAYENLAPGGWLEFQDYGLPVKSADGTHIGTSVEQWGELLCEAGRRLGRPLGDDVSANYKRWMEEAGFVDVEELHFMWPTNSWPKDPLMKEIGRWNVVNVVDGLEGFSLALLTRALGWRKEEVDVLVAKTTAGLRDKRIHGYFPIPVVYGRKPF
ncbi:hypothetical protein LTR28_007470 [Elasticomyces elasticus]|nr:hypothetical protein LTR28_007470 [Elasticomyces elasticus]